MTNVKPLRQVLENVSFEPGAATLTLLSNQHDLKRETLPVVHKDNSWIATLWVQLTDIYGARFVNAYGERDSGVWYQALYDVTEEQFRQGLYVMMRDERFETWPPNCTQFRQLCVKGQHSGLPSARKAFDEAYKHVLYGAWDWTHPAIKFTVKYVGVDVVMASDEEKAFQQFEKGYTKICAGIADGLAIPEVTDEEVTQKRTISPRVAAEMQAFIREGQSKASYKPRKRMAVSQ